MPAAGLPDKTAEFCDESQLMALRQALTVQLHWQQATAQQQQPQSQPLHGEQPPQQDHQQRTPAVSNGTHAMSIDGATPAVSSVISTARCDCRPPAAVLNCGPLDSSCNHWPMRCFAGGTSLNVRTGLQCRGFSDINAVDSTISRSTHAHIEHGWAQTPGRCRCCAMESFSPAWV